MNIIRAIRYGLILWAAVEVSRTEASSNHLEKRTRRHREKGQITLLVNENERQLKKSKYKSGKQSSKSSKKKKHKGYFYHYTPHEDIFASPSGSSPPYKNKQQPPAYYHHSEKSSTHWYYGPGWWETSDSHSKKRKSNKHHGSIFGRKSNKYHLKRKPKDTYKCSPTMMPTQRPTQNPTEKFPTSVPTFAPSESVHPSSLPSVSEAPSNPRPSTPSPSQRPQMLSPIVTTVPTRPLQTHTPSAPSSPTNNSGASVEPSSAPSFIPSSIPSLIPSSYPTALPTTFAIFQPNPSLSPGSTNSPTLSHQPTNQMSVSPTLVLTPGWNQQGGNIDGVDTSDLFGISVALSADSTIMAAGGSLNDEGGRNAGHVRALKFNATTQEWEPRGESIPGEQRLDRFGTNVALSFDGLILAASAPFHDGAAGSDSGHVRIFMFDEGSQSWSQIGDAIDGEAEGDESGTAIALSGDGMSIAIGSVRNRPNGETITGHVRVFKYDEALNQWVQQGSDIDGIREDDFWGCSVSLSFDGRVLAIGSQFFDANGINSGLVSVFNFNGEEWEPYGNPLPGAEPGDTFGTSVSLSASGRFVAGGARRGSGPSGETGHVRVFFYSVASASWRQVGETVIGEEVDEEFGVSVSISADGSAFAAGASRANDGRGLVRVYNTSDDFQWFQVGDDIEGVAADDYFGSAVALAPLSEVVAVGARFNDETGANAGQVRIYNKVNG